jgi:GrpB-like predicted nucleotidyltransferase (UPF0157 family)
MRFAPDGSRLVHLSLAEHESVFWREQLAFRDALRADPQVALRYEALKWSLAERHRNDRVAYTEAKSDFVREVLERALAEPPRSGWAGESAR